MTNTHQFDANTHINDLTHANSTVIHSLLAVHFSQSALSELYISANQHYFSSQSWCPKFCRWHNLTQLTLDLGLQVSLVFWTIYNAIDKFHAMLSQGICCSVSWLVFALIQGESKARTRTGDQFKEFAEL